MRLAERLEIWAWGPKHFPPYINNKFHIFTLLSDAYAPECISVKMTWGHHFFLSSLTSSDFPGFGHTGVESIADDKPLGRLGAVAVIGAHELKGFRSLFKAGIDAMFEWQFDRILDGCFELVPDKEGRRFGVSFGPECQIPEYGVPLLRKALAGLFASYTDEAPVTPPLKEISSGASTNWRKNDSILSKWGRSDNKARNRVKWNTCGWREAVARVSRGMVWEGRGSNAQKSLFWF